MSRHKNNQNNALLVLLKTQDQFINILSVATPNLSNLFSIVNLSTLSGNLFLAHLMILTDFDRKQLDDLNDNFSSLFPNGLLNYILSGEQQLYIFQELPIPRLTYESLGMTSQQLLIYRQLDPLLQDLAAILIFGGLCIEERVANTLCNCRIGYYVGRNYMHSPYGLEKLVKQRYIQMSKILLEL